MIGNYNYRKKKKDFSRSTYIITKWSEHHLKAIETNTECDISKAIPNSNTWVATIATTMLIISMEPTLVFSLHVKYGLEECITLQASNSMKDGGKQVDECEWGVLSGVAFSQKAKAFKVMEKAQKRIH